MRVICKNPYGELEKHKLDEFEHILGVRLASDYRHYLISYNGAQFKKNIFEIPGEGESNLHHMYGLHNGPSYFQLKMFFGENIKVQAAGYLAIADDSFGNEICIKLKGEDSGSIWFFDHEVSFNKIQSAMKKLSGSFKGFYNSLLTEKESMDRFKAEDSDGYDDFEARLNQFKKESGLI